MRNCHLGACTRTSPVLACTAMETSSFVNFTRRPLSLCVCWKPPPSNGKSSTTAPSCSCRGSFTSTVDPKSEKFAPRTAFTASGPVSDRGLGARARAVSSTALKRFLQPYTLGYMASEKYSAGGSRSEMNQSSDQTPAGRVSPSLPRLHMCISHLPSLQSLPFPFLLPSPSHLRTKILLCRTSASCAR